MVRVLPLILLLGLLAAPAVPIHGSPTIPGNQVTIHVGQGDLTGKAGNIVVYFNPKELTVDKEVPWKPHQNTEGDAPELEFTSGEPKQVSFELMFDLFEEGTTPLPAVAAALEGLVARKEPVPVTWDGRLWTSLLRQAKPRYTKFDKLGNPVRMTVSTQWSDFNLIEPHNVYPFTVEIPGVPEAGAAIREVAIDPLDLTEPPGPPQKARFTLASPRGVPPDLLKWQQLWEAGQEIRRAITVTIFDPTRTPVRSYTLDAGGPIGLEIENPNAAVPYVTLTVAYGGATFNTLPAVQVPNPASANVQPAVDRTAPFPAYGFEVEIEAVSFFFKSCSGLKIDQAVVDLEEGGINGSVRRLTGTAKWPNLTLVGEPKLRMPPIFDWVNAAAIGKPVREPIKITPMVLVNGHPEPGRSLMVQDAVPDRYVFPRLSAVRSDGEVTEQISLPPVYAVLK